MKTVIIAANGASERWRKTENYPKQLALINGETIIGRTIRLCRENGASRIFVATLSPIIREAVSRKVEVIDGSPCRWLAETILSSRPHWTGTVVGLLSDVIFTASTIQRIMNEDDGFKVWGKREEAEIFALSFSESEHERAANALRRSVQYAEGHDTGYYSLFVAYRFYCGLDPIFYHFDKNGVFQQVTDETIDIDFKKEYDDFIEKYAHTLDIELEGLNWREGIAGKDIPGYYDPKEMIGG